MRPVPSSRFRKTRMSADTSFTVQRSIEPSLLKSQAAAP
jgi:hypothetical protein